MSIERSQERKGKGSSSGGDGCEPDSARYTALGREIHHLSTEEIVDFVSANRHLRDCEYCKEKAIEAEGAADDLERTRRGRQGGRVASGQVVPIRIKDMQRHEDAHLPDDDLIDFVCGDDVPGAEAHLKICHQCQGEAMALRSYASELRAGLQSKSPNRSSKLIVATGCAISISMGYYVWGKLRKKAQFSDRPLRVKRDVAA